MLVKVYTQRFVIYVMLREW